MRAMASGAPSRTGTAAEPANHKEAWMITTPLGSIARTLVSSGRGILAADESHPTIEKRFSSLGIENTEENRRVYRQMLFTTPGVAEFISGVILFDETIRQKADDGTPLGDLLIRRGMIPEIKVDKETRPLAGARGELITEEARATSRSMAIERSPHQLAGLRVRSDRTRTPHACSIRSAFEIGSAPGRPTTLPLSFTWACSLSTSRPWPFQIPPLTSPRRGSCSRRSRADGPPRFPRSRTPGSRPAYL